MTSSLIALILLSFCLGCGCWLFFLWGVHRGEFSDMERPKHRMLDDEAPLPRGDERSPAAPNPPSTGNRDTASAQSPKSRQEHPKSH